MLNPACQVVVLYKNIITYGFREKYYLEARRRGVLFVRYTDDDPPHGPPGAARRRRRWSCRCDEHVFGKTLAFEPDLLALSMSIEPSAGPSRLAELLGVPLSPEGFFQEAHLKMRPMDFADDGMFLAGMAHYPKFIEESITHALACAGAGADGPVAGRRLQLGGVVAVVDPDRCTGCLTCVRTCPFGIPTMRCRPGRRRRSGRRGLDRSGPLPGLRHLHRRVPGPGHPVAQLSATNRSASAWEAGRCRPPAGVTVERVDGPVTRVLDGTVATACRLPDPHLSRAAGGSPATDQA